MKERGETVPVPIGIQYLSEAAFFSMAAAGDQRSAPLLFATCKVDSTGTKHKPLLLKSFAASFSPG